MEQYVVSSRKYRPVTFDTVVSQHHVTATLKNAIKNNHLAQAFLFCGPRGVGKTTCARILAKTINCLNLTSDLEPCNECESCKAFNHSASFNIYELDAASNNSVEDIRALVDQVRYAPQGAKYKIYIIDEVHMLSTAAFNAFLKTLEEPPSYAIFILATTERHKILPTILSRCQVFNFNRITVEEIVGQLKRICETEKIEAEEEALYTIARKADGAMRDALTILDQMVSFAGNSITYKHVAENLNILDYEYYFNMTDALLNQHMSKALNLFDEVLLKGFDAHLFLNGLSEHYRNLLVCKDQATLKLMEVPETAANRYKAQSNLASTAFLLNALNITNQADLNYKTSRNTRLHVEVALIKMCHILSVIHIKADEADKKKTDVESSTTSAKNPAPIPAKQVAAQVSPKVSLSLNKADLLAQLKSKENQSKESEVVEQVHDNEIILTDLNEVSLAEIKAQFKAHLDKKGLKNIVSNFDTIQFEIEGTRRIIVKALGVIAKVIEEEKSDLILIARGVTGFKPTADIQTIKLEQQGTYYFTNEERFKKLVEDYPMLKEFAKLVELRAD